jgi:hypothetical protein
MTKLLQQALAEVRELPDETQDLAAQAMFMVIQHSSDEGRYRLSEEEISGVHHAMRQADRGDFASEKQITELFDSSL